MHFPLMPVKKVFVAGSSGLLGRSFVSNPRVGFQIQDHGFSQGATHRADLGSAAEAKAMLDALHPDIVLNLVALTNVDDCEKLHQRAYDLNVETPTNLAAWCRENHKILIQISTDQVYDGPGLCKESQVTLLNNYSLTKRAGELPALFTDGVVLRTNFFGKSLVPGRASFSDWLRNSFAQGTPLNLFHDVYFSPLHLSTLCDALWRVLENPIPGIYNLGSHEGMSKEEFARGFASALGCEVNAKSVSIKDSNLLAKRPSEMRMDVSKFEAAYGIALPRLQDEIEKESRYEIQS